MTEPKEFDVSKASKLREIVLAELENGRHTEAFADGARWATQEAENLLDLYDARVSTAPRKREIVTGYLADGRTVDLIGEHVSHCANPKPHEVHYPDFKVGEGSPKVAAAGTYVCPGVPPTGP